MDQMTIKKGFKGLGICFLAGSFTFMAGYYWGDRGLRLFPDTAGVVLLLCGIGFSCLFIASCLTVPGFNSKGRRQSRVILGLLSLIFLGLFVACRLMPKPDSVLLSLPRQQFDLCLARDIESLDTCEKELNALLERLAARQDIFSESPEQMLSASQEQFLRQVWREFTNYARAVDQIRSFYTDWYLFDLSRQERTHHVQSFLLMADAETLLVEKTFRVLHLIKPYPAAAAFLDSPDPAYEIGPNSFSRIQTDFFGTDSMTRLLSMRAYLQWLDHGLEVKNREYSGICYPLWETIDTHYALIDEIEPLTLGKEVVDADLEHLRRGAGSIWFPAQKGVAEWMGGTRLYRVGQYLITPELQEELDRRLEPGDVLLSRKNWYLSNVGLPGFWPHAVLYIGDPQKLLAYFDDPAVLDYLKTRTGEDLSLDDFMARSYPQKWLRYKAGSGSAGYQTLEAIKPGVVLHPLSEACGDYMVAIRPRLDKVAKAQAIIEAFKHLDKPYDFDFDFSTDHALVCTELVWRSYRPDVNKQGLHLEPIEIAGRKTLPANEIAALYVREHKNPDRQFDFVCFIDARESEETAFFADENAFTESVSRPKWSFALE